MGKAGSKLSAKERIGYEVFFFTAVYGLYNVFFALPLLIDTLVFIALFGSLFVRYHLVVSDEDLDESPAARMTGTAMFVVSVAISHLIFQSVEIGDDRIWTGVGAVSCPAWRSSFRSVSDRSVQSLRVPLR